MQSYTDMDELHKEDSHDSGCEELTHQEGLGIHKVTAWLGAAVFVCQNLKYLCVEFMSILLEALKTFETF